ncbi:MAG: FAD-binding protein [bacterium]
MADQVAIIGGGLAGVTAALFAFKQGARPVLVKKGGGATSFSSGGLDLAVDPYPPPQRPDKVETRSRKNLARYVLNMPQHPYLTLVGKRDEDESENIMQMLKAACEEVFPEGSELELEGDVELARPLFTSLGTVKYTNLFPARTAGPESPGLAKPLVAGVRGLVDFDPWSAGQVAAENAQRMGVSINPSIAWIAFGEQERQTPALAAAIEQDPAAFLEAVAALDVTGAESLLLPPALPLARRHSILKELEERLSLPVYETLSLPPSVPGLRLSSYLAGLLREKEIPVINGTVTGYRADTTGLTGLEIEPSSNPGDKAQQWAGPGKDGMLRLPVSSVVLAAGKFAAGGLAKKRSFREKIFDLPVAVNGEFCGELFVEKVLGHHVSDSHLLFSAGVLTDRELRPLDPQGDPVYQNLYAAGGVLSGNDYMTQGTGAGVALASGLKAGENTAKRRD